MVFVRLLLARAIRLRLVRFLGVFALAGAMLLHTSADNPPVLGRWSYAYAAALLLALGCGAAALVASVRLANKPIRPTVRLDGALADIGLLTWGLSSLASAAASPTLAG